MGETLLAFGGFRTLPHRTFASRVPQGEPVTYKGEEIFFRFISQKDAAKLGFIHGKPRGDFLGDNFCPDALVCENF